MKASLSMLPAIMHVASTGYAHIGCLLIRSPYGLNILRLSHRLELRPLRDSRFAIREHPIKTLGRKSLNPKPLGSSRRAGGCFRNTTLRDGPGVAFAMPLGAPTACLRAVRNREDQTKTGGSENSCLFFVSKVALQDYGRVL